MVNATLVCNFVILFSARMPWENTSNETWFDASCANMSLL